MKRNVPRLGKRNPRKMFLLIPCLQWSNGRFQGWPTSPSWEVWASLVFSWMQLLLFPLYLTKSITSNLKGMRLIQNLSVSWDHERERDGEKWLEENTSVIEAPESWYNCKLREIVRVSQWSVTGAEDHINANTTPKIDFLVDKAFWLLMHIFGILMDDHKNSVNLWLLRKEILILAKRMFGCENLKNSWLLRLGEL